MSPSPAYRRYSRTSDSFHRGVPFGEAKSILKALLASGDLIEVRVEGWKAVHYALGSDAQVLQDVSAGRVPQAWTPLATTTTEEVVFLAPLDQVSARDGPKFCSASTTCGRSTSPSLSASSATTRCRFCGATGSSRASTANSTGRPTRSSSWACGWRMKPSARTRHLRRHWHCGLARFVTFLGASKLDATAIGEPLLRQHACSSIESELELDLLAINHAPKE